MDGLFVKSAAAAATVRSYGIGADFTDGVRLARTHSEFVELSRSPTHRFCGRSDFPSRSATFSSAVPGIQPGVPLEAQSPDDLVWIRDRFLGTPDFTPRSSSTAIPPTASPK